MTFIRPKGVGGGQTFNKGDNSLKISNVFVIGNFIDAF